MNFYLGYAEHYKIVKLNKDTDEIKILNQKQALMKLNFLKELTQSYIDTYFIVGETIHCLMVKGVTIEQKSLT